MGLAMSDYRANLRKCRFHAERCIDDPVIASIWMQLAEQYRILIRLEEQAVRALARQR
jgi:hypothetical protein